MSGARKWARRTTSLAVGVAVAILAVAPPAAAAAVPGTPGSPTATAGNGSATVKWSAAPANWSTITAYVVTPVVDGTPQEPVTVAPTPTTRVLTGLANGTTYTFRIAAKNGIGTGPFATTAPVTVGLPGAPPLPAVAPAGNGAAKVAWWAAAANGSPVTGYVVTPYAGGVAQAPRTFATAATSQVITGLTNTVSYTFKISAVNAAGTGPASTSPALVVGLPGAPGTPQPQSGNGAVTLKWGAAAANGTAVSGYVVTPYVGTTALTPQTFATPATTQTIGGLTNGTTYTFKVAAVNAAGTGPVATSAAVAVGLPGGTPFPSAVASNGSVKVAWWAAAANGSPVTGYVVTPVTGSTVLPSVAVGPTPTNRTITGLTNGATYTFRIAAVNGVGTGPRVTTPAVVVGLPTAPAKPTAVVASAGLLRATVSWSAPSGGWPAITGYVVTPTRDGVAQPPITFSSTATSQVVTGLASGSTYSFTVAATNVVGTGPASPASAPVTPQATVPGAPTSVTAGLGHGQATVSWTEPEVTGGVPITGYVVTPHVDGTTLEPVAFADPSISQRIEGLDDGTTYTFTVEAVNSLGTGPASAESDPVTPSLPPLPTPGTIDIVGDSITMQSYWFRDEAFAAGMPAGSDVVKNAFLGFKFEDVQPGEEARVREAGRPSVLVIALGTNNASPSNGGWTTSDEVAFRRLLDTPHPDTCVVTVLPGYGPQAPDAHKVQEELAREAMDRRARERPGTVVADWGAVALAHPEYLDADGIHLNRANEVPPALAEVEAADAFAAVIWDAVAECPPSTLTPQDGFQGLASPLDVAFDAEGNTYVADFNNDRVERLAPDGSQTTLAFTGLDGPAAVEIDAAGNVVVTDSGHGRVVQLAPDGTETTLGFTDLVSPVGLAISGNGDVFVADPQAGRVLRLEPDGTQSVVEVTGTGAPLGLALDGDGRLYVTDNDVGRVVRVDPDGTQVTLVESGLQGSIGVAVAGDGTVYVSDTGHDRVVRVEPDGSVTRLSLSLLARPAGLVVDGAGVLWVTDSGHNRLLRWPA